MDREMTELEEKIIKQEKNFKDYNSFWKERVAYISVIVALIVGLIMTVT